MSVSDEFRRSFPGGGQTVLECCRGRWHHAVGREAEHVPPHEVPTGAVKHLDCDTITAMDIGGNLIVDGCTCGKGERIESMFNTLRPQIMRYYKAASDRKAAELKCEEEQLRESRE